MKTEVKEKWITALRSGEFEQSIGMLQRTEAQDPHFRNQKLKTGFCCLGVLCEIAVREAVIPTPRQDAAEGSYFYGAGDNWNSCALPPEVTEWAELSSSDPVVRVTGAPAVAGRGSMELSEVNDVLRYSFDEIADLIEAQL